MRYNTIDPTFFTENRKQFTTLLPPGSIAIFHSNDVFPRNGDQNFPFRQQSDLFYLSGLDQEETILVLAPGHPDEGMREVAFVTETNEKIAIWEGQKLTKEKATAISGIKKIQWTRDFDIALKELIIWAKHVYLNSNEYPKYSNPVPYKDLRFARELKEEYPAHNYERSAPLMLELRKIKKPIEVELIRRAGEITGKAFDRVLKTVRPGTMEYEVQAEIEYAFAMNRATGPAYRPIVAAGENSCVLHYIDNNQVCRDGELLLMDFGAEYANYAADITRTIPVNGKFTTRQKACYEAVLRVHDKAIQLLRPGITIDEFNKEVNKMMEKEMIGLGLFSEADVKSQDANKPLYMKYFMHGTAHPLGLDVHDVGSKYDPVEAGMVLTCEPGLYIREEKIGIRIEDDILVTDNAPVNLTGQVPVKVEEIEALMNRE
ncbi:MAG: aminopeptidase P N-terminal domain-containing protein [Bacteroidales bacterium]|nr:aminopeptidase P N-terminal domain-containing protein [Bacteroidales bacterium]